MTENTASRPLLPLLRGRLGAPAHPVPAEETPAAPAVLRLPGWLPRPVLGRGGVATRDDDRALRDLHAARDRSDW